MVKPIGEGSKSISSLGSTIAKGDQTPEIAQKVADVVQIPVMEQTGLRKRKITPLNQAQDLIKKIQKNWNSWELEALAENIIDLEDRVSNLDPKDPGVAKVKMMAETLHFVFVYPIAKELEKSESSFYDNIKRIANKIIKESNVSHFCELNPRQQKEIYHYMAGGRR